MILSKNGDIVDFIGFYVVLLFFFIALITYFVGNNIVFVLIQLITYITIYFYIRYLDKNANIDKLTLIYNRRYFDIVLEAELKKQRKRRYSLALLICDIDNFKLVNDSFGHITGDHILSRTAYIIKTNVRKSDIVFRWGGEEFAIIMPNSTNDEAALISEQIRKAIEKFEFENNIFITISGGVVTYENKVSTAEIVIAADKALYKAKARKNTIICKNI